MKRGGMKEKLRGIDSLFHFTPWKKPGQHIKSWFRNAISLLRRALPPSKTNQIDSPDAAEVLQARPAVQDIATGREFRSFALPESILKGLQEAGFERCTPIQERTLPLSLQGRDVAAQAQTGTGKTAAFLITIFERLLHTVPKPTPGPHALILAPTRELALQIYHDARALSKYTELRISAVYGGVSYQPQLDELAAGTDVVIATPGRLIDYLKQKAFGPHHIQVLVIDEADRMFDMGFINDLRYILRRLPPYTQRQSMLFSATLSARVLELTYEYMNAPEEIIANPDVRTVETVEQLLYHISEGEKLPLLLGLLKREQWKRVLIFTNTKAKAARLEEKLQLNGFPARALTGDLNQARRTRVLGQFRQGKLHILVATDVASRGIHVDDVSHVVNYDLPQDREDYVHRIGRTARAGKPGKAISFACEKYVYHLEPIEQFIGQKIPVVWVEDDGLVPDASLAQMPKVTSGTGQRFKAPTRKRSPERKAPRPPKRGQEKPPRRGLKPTAQKP
jgi:ATP-dependent RNA helicase RhlB